MRSPTLQLGNLEKTNALKALRDAEDNVRELSRQMWATESLDAAHDSIRAELLAARDIEERAFRAWRALQ